MGEQYYVRARGNVTGPFDLAEMRSLIRRGVVSRVHEVSADGEPWKRASQFAELFPPPPLPPSPAAAPTPVIPPQPSATPAPVQRFFYAQYGATVGPVPLAILRALAENGVLQATALVWEEGGPARAAAKVQALATAYPAPPAPAGTRDLSDRMGMVGLVSGIGAGVLVLLLLNLPIAVVDGRALWCWNLVGSPGSGVFSAICIVLLLTGLALGFGTPLLSGAGRGILLMSAAGTTALALLITSLFSEFPEALIVAAMAFCILPALAAMLSGTARYRRAAGDVARGLQGALAIGCCAVAVTLAALLLRDTVGAAPLKAAFITLGVVMSAAAVGAGVVALVDLSGGRAAMTARATSACAEASVLLAPVVLVFLALTVADAVSRLFPGASRGQAALARPALFLLLRFGAMTLALAAVAGVGMLQLLLSQSHPAGTPPHP